MNKSAAPAAAAAAGSVYINSIFKSNEAHRYLNFQSKLCYLGVIKIMIDVYFNNHKNYKS